MHRTSRVSTKAGVVAVSLLGGYAAFQIALAAGAPLGRAAWGGRNRVLPGPWRAASVGSAIVMVVLAVVAARVSGLLGSRAAGTWRHVALAAGLMFVLGVPMNLASRSPVERWHALPVAALAASFLVLWRTGAGP